MALQLRALQEVRAFSIAPTAIFLLGPLVLQNLFIPTPLVDQIRWSGTAIALSLARLLRDNCRAEDLVARFGGKGFVLWLASTSLTNGVSVAERMRSKTTGPNQVEVGTE